MKWKLVGFFTFLLNSLLSFLQPLQYSANYLEKHPTCKDLSHG
ncbi:hypothetical protein QWZ13_02150 [Reinekea marina]|nr:hypothetical protein [Reinekea marina]MDN3647709.1 hypothetical protein [Reinekea marina]